MGAALATARATSSSPSRPTSTRQSSARTRGRPPAASSSSPSPCRRARRPSPLQAPRRARLCPLPRRPPPTAGRVTQALLRDAGLPFDEEEEEAAEAEGEARVGWPAREGGDGGGAAAAEEDEEGQETREELEGFVRRHLPTADAALVGEVAEALAAEGPDGALRAFLESREWGDTPFGAPAAPEEAGALDEVFGRRSKASSGAAGPGWESLEDVPLDELQAELARREAQQGGGAGGAPPPPPPRGGSGDPPGAGL